MKSIIRHIEKMKQQEAFNSSTARLKESRERKENIEEINHWLKVWIKHLKKRLNKANMVGWFINLKLFEFLTVS